MPVVSSPSLDASFHLLHHCTTHVGSWGVGPSLGGVPSLLSGGGLGVGGVLVTIVCWVLQQRCFVLLQALSSPLL